ncbi:MAG: inorganic phosphate transporter [Candidatus Electryonea clarkiae]|nr:inorganic phosphate transporter [Candidatus Electryonea clarkiae]MDP8288123.1 inorganic phosphate transporter [Candidatus Electryonea clarkiae]
MELLSNWFGTTEPTMVIAALLAVVFGSYMAWTIGANDVANAMATSVGSSTLTYRQAIVIAGIMEFAGAVLAGSHVTDTIRKGIINAQLFESDPHLLMYGMLSALLAAAIWLHVATLLGLPVSTTHSIVGAVVGFGILIYGLNAIHWVKIVQIVLSWVISPVAGGIVAYLLFKLIRKKIFAAQDTRKALINWAPLFAGLTLSIIVLAVIYKGLKNLNLNLPPNKAFLVAAAIGIITYILFSVILRHKKETSFQNIKSIESVFKILGMITAAYLAFAHGANDVANAIGPVAAVIATVGEGVVALKVGVPLWILYMGGIGIVLGLATQGYKVMRTVGSDITKLTPSRGFTAAFSAASVVVICSRLGLPVSTTHTLVGAVLGVGIAQGIDSIDLRVVRSIVNSWLLTLPVAAALSIIIFLILKLIFHL